jgi:hypothetical protein
MDSRDGLSPNIWRVATSPRSKIVLTVRICGVGLVALFKWCIL